MLVFVIFLFLLVSGVAGVCDCGTPSTFLLTFLEDNQFRLATEEAVLKKSIAIVDTCLSIEKENIQDYPPVCRG